MLNKRLNRTRVGIGWLTLVALLAMPLSLVAQTQIQYHNNKFSVQDDVKLGRQAAREAEQQFPLLRDENARAYVERVGQRRLGGSRTGIGGAHLGVRIQSGVYRGHSRSPFGQRLRDRYRGGPFQSMVNAS